MKIRTPFIENHRRLVFVVLLTVTALAVCASLAGCSSEQQKPAASPTGCSDTRGFPMPCPPTTTIKVCPYPPGMKPEGHAETRSGVPSGGGKTDINPVPSTIPEECQLRPSPQSVPPPPSSPTLSMVPPPPTTMPPSTRLINPAPNQPPPTTFPPADSTPSMLPPDNPCDSRPELCRSR